MKGSHAKMDGRIGTRPSQGGIWYFLRNVEGRTEAFYPIRHQHAKLMPSVSKKVAVSVRSKKGCDVGSDSDM